MKKQLCILAPAIAVLSAALLSQTTPTIGQVTMSFRPQQTEVYGEVDGELGVLFTSGPGSVQALTGRPFSATETTRSEQTLSDGTEISHSDSHRIYRDILGRVRTESTAGDQTVIIIRDNVNGYNLRLFPDSKTAIRNTVAGRGGRAGAIPVETAAGTIAIAPAPVPKKKAGRKSNQTTDEDLGIQNINGVPALGKRHTQIIPVGQIGNNREIHVVHESWYSDDLQMLVKSVNSDPRYGVNTYELTDISRDNPDPSLFQVPPGYSVTEGGRGARGGISAGRGVPGTVVTVPANVVTVPAKKNQ